jgi:hypothetical protein|tara:strand:+ start:299 stop:490 length:192 start_codon:yes stop_codon:yes gene_type:complete
MHISSIGEVSETKERHESAGIDVMGYTSRWGHYRIRLQPGEIEKHKEILADLDAEAYAVGGQK